MTRRNTATTKGSRSRVQDLDKFAAGWEAAFGNRPAWRRAFDRLHRRARGLVRRFLR